jgi:hypothetical protein
MFLLQLPSLRPFATMLPASPLAPYHLLPASDPIERLWGPTHRHVTHNKCYVTSRDFAGEVLTFLREKVPQNWADLCDSVTDNFRVINPRNFRILA